MLSSSIHRTRVFDFDATFEDEDAFLGSGFHASGVGWPLAGPTTVSDRSSKYACPGIGAVYMIHAQISYVSGGTSPSTMIGSHPVVPYTNIDDFSTAIPVVVWKNSCKPIWLCRLSAFANAVSRRRLPMSARFETTCATPVRPDTSPALQNICIDDLPVCAIVESRSAMNGGNGGIETSQPSRLPSKPGFWSRLVLSGTSAAGCASTSVSETSSNMTCPVP